MDGIAAGVEHPSIVPLPFGSGYPMATPLSRLAQRPSIVPLPFGSGYLRSSGPQHGGAFLQLCRSLSGAVMVRWQEQDAAGNFVLQLCRSLSGAVIRAMPEHPLAMLLILQLCRSLSGAVMAGAAPAEVGEPALQLCRSLSGAVIHRIERGDADFGGPFNCAAPFRERLFVYADDAVAGLSPSIVPLPFGSGYIDAHLRPQQGVIGLQLCRSLSGAVISPGRRPSASRLDPSIVPLPFGSGYLPRRPHKPETAVPSIVPLPFGSGYSVGV